MPSWVGCLLSGCRRCCPAAPCYALTRPPPPALLCRGAPAPAGGGDGGGACISKSVGAYFHEDGQLAGDVIRRDAQALLQQFLEAKSK